MRSVLLVIFLLLATPFSAATSGEPIPVIDLENQGEEILSTYTRGVQLAFEQVSNLEQYSTETLATTNEWLVVTHFPIDKQNLIGVGQSESRPAPLLLGSYIWTLDNPLKAIPLFEQALERGDIESFSPLVKVQQTPRGIPNDENFSAQWHLQNTGQTGGTNGEDANLSGIWNSYTGHGVTISIVDDGLDRAHPDISPRYSAANSYDWCDDDSDPSPESWNGHGTAAAGVAAAAGDNSIHVAGAAYNADIAGSTLIACWSPDSMEANALSYNNDDIDIYSNSWGPADNGQTLSGPGPLMMAAFEDDVYNGRNGSGNIITWAAGNGLGSNDNANYDGYTSSRYTIGVAAITHYGEQSYYSEPGASTLIAAHSNGNGEAITTTDIADDPSNFSDDKGYGNGNVTHTFGGTSSATPLASGVIALILQANENLTWRDLQHVLVNSARKNDPNDSDWTINGAGHDVSHKYGFGAIDAGAAVLLAENWTNVDEEMNATYGPFYPSLSIPTGSSNWTEFTTTVTDDFAIETVEVIVDIDHSSRGDLQISLVSPSGTESLLSEEHDDDGDDYSNWMFTTVQHWDEESLGDWTLKLRDETAGSAGTINSWEMILHGTDIDLDHDDDGLSDLNETNVFGTDPYDADTDDDGLNDYDEIVVYGTDPNMPDTDLDGLSDSVEINPHGTDPLDSDTDDDGLSDGVEVNYWMSNPLVYDPDADSDLFYHFIDCDDGNPEVNPGKPEKLNGIDDDCDDLTDEGFNFTDRDNDGLKDWPEYHIHGTDWKDSDTDGDGLQDGEEVNTYADLGADPLVVDVDFDSDGWYWFQDCADDDIYRSPGLSELLDGIDNDCDEIIDEDFMTIDTDNDGLFDYDEYHNYSTDANDGDTDNDGLPDGAEVNTYSQYGADPLIYDPDADADGWYWFEDCEDSDNERSPSLSESLDGKDNDCDEVIDEDFMQTDIDQDGLTDYVEFHNITSDPEDPDTDDDGMSDGEEVLVTGSNPIVHNFDKDEDGFYDFEDCQDLVPTIYPGADESWNGWDDDCNEVVDDQLERKDLVSTVPAFGVPQDWDAVNKTLVIGINGIPNIVDREITWSINGFDLQNNLSDDNSRLDILPLDCEKKIDELTHILCRNGTSVQTVTATIVDSGFTTILTWDIQMTVWIPPATFLEKFIGFMTSGFGIGILVFLLISIFASAGLAYNRMRQNQLLKDAYSAYNIKPHSFSTPEQRTYELPSAPELHSSYEINPVEELDLPAPPPMQTEEISVVEVPSHIIERNDEKTVDIPTLTSHSVEEEIIDLQARPIDETENQ